MVKATKFLYSFLAVALIAVCSIVFTACGGGDSLEQEATYAENINYTENATTADTNPAVDAIMAKIERGEGGQVTNFSVLNGFRFTMIAKDTSGIVRQKLNIVAKNKELMARTTMSYDSISGEANIYIKGDKLYTHNKRNGEAEVKIVTNVGTNSFEASLTSTGLMQMFSEYVSQLKDVGYTIKKNGTNFKFTYSSTTLGNVSKVIILQMDNDNNVKAIHIEYSSSLTGSTEMTLSAFDGDLVFPDLSGYTAA